MKKLLLSILLSGALSGFTKNNTIYHPNQFEKVNHLYIDIKTKKLINGLIKTTKEKVQIVQGQPNGVLRRYTSKGKISLDGVIHLTIFTGRIHSYYKSGRLESTIFFKDLDLPKFQESGEPSLKMKSIIGWQVFNPKGLIIRDILRKNEETIEYTYDYYDTGELKDSIKFLLLENRAPRLKETFYKKDGKLWKEVFYKDNKKSSTIYH